MRPPIAEHSHLAAAYLALADDVAPAPDQRTVPRVLCALAATVVLAVAAPLAWAAAAPGEPRDLPAATAGGKAGGVAADEDDDAAGDAPDGLADGAVDGDDDDGGAGGEAWAATVG